MQDLAWQVAQNRPERADRHERQAAGEERILFEGTGKVHTRQAFSQIEPAPANEIKYRATRRAGARPILMDTAATRMVHSSQASVYSEAPAFLSSSITRW